MSTRGKVVIITESGNRYGIFNRTDSYPLALGNECLDWIKANKKNFKKISKKLDQLNWIKPKSEGGIPAAEEKELLNLGYKWLSDDQYFIENMEELQQTEDVSNRMIMNDIEFDGLFCEYTYTIDLQQKLFGFDSAMFKFSKLPEEFK